MTHDGVSRETREGAPTLNLVAVAQMTRTGEPETVSLTVNGPTRTYDQHTKPTPRAGSGAGATDRMEHMQEQKNNTEPKFTTNVYIHEPDIQIHSVALASERDVRTQLMVHDSWTRSSSSIAIIHTQFDLL